MFRFHLALFTAGLCLVTSSAGLAQGRGGGMHAGDSFKNPKVPAWRGNAEVAGTITDEAGKGIADVKVTFVFVASNDGFFATTKKNGEFSAKDIKAGEWRVQVDAANFITVRQTVTITDSKKAPLAITLKRDNSPELLTRAEALFTEGKLAEARTEYLTVLAAHPELSAINRAIAFTYGREKNHPEALKYLDLALAANPNDATLLQLAAASAMEVADFPRAMGYLGKIDEAALADPEPLVNAAMNLLNKRRSGEALVLLNRVIARFPTAPDPYFYRAYGSLQMQKPADAKPDLEKYLSLAPPNAPNVEQAKDLLSKIK
jgi:tetratricopeptide (TPR) repeat protein